jgi:hypothetical protein
MKDADPIELSLRCLEWLACQHVFVPSNCLYRVMSCHVVSNSRVVMPLNLVLSYCNKECLSMCALSEIRLSFKIETFLCMITKFLNKPLQMTTLVDFAIPPKKCW